MSEYTQQSFSGGMNMLADDTRLQTNQYRVGFNLRNRYDILDPVLESEIDVALPVGIVQEMTTFGNFIIVFVSGKAYYRYFASTGWQQIVGFSMLNNAPRYWSQVVPVALTNYVRKGIVPTGETEPDARGGIINGISSAFAGNNPGLLVQDNVNQPQFIYLDSLGYPAVRVTQTYDQWSITSTDLREYVPIGNTMAWVDGILYIASQDGEAIYRSVSGRPLDFVVAVDENGDKEGDATTTSYSVGVGGIRCLRQMSDGSLFVAASNANFLVSKNMTQNAPTLFGEYTFIRTFLFNATCLSDRVILDSLGDTRFIDLTGVRSFNAIKQTQNEGRNTPFTATIQAAFGQEKSKIIQDADYSAAIYYDNYEFYAVNTIFGPVIAVYDTLNQCWSSFDTDQTGGQRIKILAKIELTIQRLYAVTEDNKLYTLYIGPGISSPKFRPISASSLLVKTEQGYSVSQKSEIKLTDLRCVFNLITKDTLVTATPYVNNRLAGVPATPKYIYYAAPTTVSSETMPDIDTQLSNVLFTFPNCGQGWKSFVMLEWAGSGSLTQFTYTFNDLTPMSPLLSQR